MRIIISLLTILAILNTNSIAQDTNQTDSKKDSNKMVTISVDFKHKKQQIHNIGASGCWFSEPIGKYWPVEKKERIAELLFSNDYETNGTPKGIGLSAWRFNIGGGTDEQGDSSSIFIKNKRVECFLNPDGSYNWDKQPGYRWFLNKAIQYKVKDLIAFVNTPPVFWNRNARGFKFDKDGYSNLKPDKYDAFADFLADVLLHFENEKIHFNYISPINEPQWEWNYDLGKAKQEGCPYTNEEASKVVIALDKALTKQKLNNQILFPEAGMIFHLYSKGKPQLKSSQIATFWDKESPLFIGNLPHLSKFVAGHSYFTDNNTQNIISTRTMLADTLKKYDKELEYWQTEYCLLGNGYKEGKEKATNMDCGLFVAKIIHHDFTVGNATAWQFWNSYEPGGFEFDARYYLIALKPNEDFTDGQFTPTKNLYALGHYSLFVRPGMYRLPVDRSDGMTPEEAAQKLMISAFIDETTQKLVIIAINYSQKLQTVRLADNIRIKKIKRFVTTDVADDNLKPYPVSKTINGIELPSRSITTLVVEYK
jgi:O-glycosyl hydrolase